MAPMDENFFTAAANALVTLWWQLLIVGNFLFLPQLWLIRLHQCDVFSLSWCWVQNKDIYRSSPTYLIVILLVESFLCVSTQSDLKFSWSPIPWTVRSLLCPTEGCSLQQTEFVCSGEVSESPEKSNFFFFSFIKKTNCALFLFACYVCKTTKLHIFRWKNTFCVSCFVKHPSRQHWSWWPGS